MQIHSLGAEAYALLRETLLPFAMCVQNIFKEVYLL